MTQLRWIFVMLLMASVPSRLAAQEASQDAQAPDAGEQVEPAPPIPEPPASPPPGDEVMHPTEHGLRFTPRMIEGFGRQFTKEELGDGLGLDDAQRQRMTDLVTRRAQDLNVRMGRQGRDAIERFYEGLIRQEIRGQKTMTADDAREFSEKVRPGVRIVDEFWNGILEDARPVLDDEQYGELEKKAQEVLRATRKFDERMDRWSRGEVKENESIVDGLDENDVETETTGKSKEYVQAERNVRWRVQMMGPIEWRQFLGRVNRVCKFDDQQRKDGDKLLRAYSEKAKPIMTKEWKRKATDNQVRHQLQEKLSKEPLEPWIYHLDIDYKELVEPIQEMGRAFHREVLALATPEQRRLIADALIKLALDHGMKEVEVDTDPLVQSLAQGEPQAATEPAP